MVFKIIKNDFARNKAVSITVFVFITLAVLLGASATNIIANLIQSIS
jgi:putative ABC transport system permease protein